MNKISEKFLTMADKMQGDIENKLGDRQENTPKRQREAESARTEGRRLKRTQFVLRVLAHLHENDQVPEILSGIKSKKDVYSNMGSKVNHNGGYNTPSFDTHERYLDTPEAVELWALIVEPSEEDLKREEIKRKVNELKFSKIPGYFPTPIELIDIMIDRAGIEDNNSILEPSAGSGAIADRVKEKFPTTHIDVVEHHHSLFAILALKSVGKYDSFILEDFLNLPIGVYYDRIIMNPPFEKLQDIDHVMKAYAHLKEGGRLVAIMSPGPFHNYNKKASDFRIWFEDTACGYVESIESGAFKESGTMVSSRLVVIDK